MADYRVTGYIHMESTRDEANYDVIMEYCDYPPSPMEIFDYLVSSGEIQIIEQTWEEVDKDGVGV